MTWSTKRDGYRASSYDRNNLGNPVERMTPNAGTTHAIIIPGTTYKAFLTLEESGELVYTPTRYSAAPVKMAQLMAGLKRSTIAGPGKRRIKASPVLMTIEEFAALTTEVKAA